MLAVQSIRFLGGNADDTIETKGCNAKTKKPEMCPVEFTTDELKDFLASLGIPLQDGQAHKAVSKGDPDNLKMLQSRKLETFKQSWRSRYCHITLVCGEIE